MVRERPTNRRRFERCGSPLLVLSSFFAERLSSVHTLCLMFCRHASLREVCLSLLFYLLFFFALVLSLVFSLLWTYFNFVFLVLSCILFLLVQRTLCIMHRSAYNTRSGVSADPDFFAGGDGGNGLSDFDTLIASRRS